MLMGYGGFVEDLSVKHNLRVSVVEEQCCKVISSRLGWQLWC